jgi:ATP-dependent exoDNAse (exonuclease V) beta subunit
MPITIYTASAGSGKTYALTREYLRTALAQPAQAAAYRQLLAITFTNKAADEMKSRIIERLHAIATGNDKQIVEMLSTTPPLSPDELPDRARALLSAILHDYSRFAISTIDAFFQKIVRAFMREMGLLPTFLPEVEHDRLLDTAVDALWHDAATNEPLRVRLINLCHQRIAAGKSWNARSELKAMGGEIFKEVFLHFGRTFTDKIADTDFLTNYEQQLKTIITDFTATMRGIGKQALAALHENNFTVTDFKYKTASFASYFTKITIQQRDDNNYIPSTRVLQALDNEDRWMTGIAGKDAQVRTVIFPTVNPLLNKAITHYRQAFTVYRTAREILKNLYSMALLADVSKKVTAIAADENKLPISHTLSLLRTVIGENDTPFVYEKTGVHYHSFMLDEFQDTSNMQWESLRPLLLNGLSEGGQALAVGDVKQSIYRWRNGDWRILAHGLADYFTAFTTENVVLDTNWRSREVIVEINNHLFTRLPALLQQNLNNALEESTAANLTQTTDIRTIITDAYTATIQKVSPAKTGSGGFVQIETVHREDDDGSGEATKAKEKVLQTLTELIAGLQDRGYRASDIAVLVRYRREGQEVADALLHHKQTTADTTHCFEVLSSDSLFLERAPVVQFAMAVLNLSVSPDDAVSRTLAERYLQQTASGERLTASFLERLLYQPLPEAVETLIAHFRLNENPANWAFLQEWQDIALTYANSKRNDIFGFVQHWKETGASKALSMTDTREAIRILTIHKSKGLQFPVVIIPFCHWDIDPKPNSLLWVKAPDKAPAGPDYLPLNYTKALAGTLFNVDYWEERAQSAIDNLNLLYVAFTRAEEELYAFVPQPSRKKSNSFAAILPELLQTDHYTAGVQTPRTTAPAPTGTLAVPLKHYTSLPYSNHLRIKYAEEQLTDMEATSVRDYGILMHRAFAHITSKNEVDAAIAKLVEQGFLADEATCRSHLRGLLMDALNQPGVQEWFDGIGTILTETNLLLPATGNAAPQQLRPDRVIFRDGKVTVIDYKFGKNKSPKHILQIQNYMKHIKTMGYIHVAGYCWYVSLALIDSVRT